MDAVLSVEDKLEFLIKRFYSVASCGTSFRSSFSDAIDCFIQTGNTAPVTRNEIVCVNPTLLKHGYLEMNIASNPFDAFFPIAFNEDTQDINTYNYCKAKLGLLVSEFIKHKERIKSYFHFGNCLELCLYKEDVKKICHIIFCSISIEHNLGLPNLFTAAKECLSETSDSAILLTSINLPNLNLSKRSSCSPVEYIETVLSCPLSMVPTLYGLKLSNHLKLGSPDCIKLHDTITKYFLTLKWLKAPGYSNNIKLDISPPLKKSISLLAASRFEWASSHPFFCQLLTYYHIFKSFADRFHLFPDISTLQSLIQAQEVSAKYSLAWRTEKAWMNGEPVLAYSFGKFRRELRNSLLEQVQLQATSSIFFMLGAPIAQTAAAINDPSRGFMPENIMDQINCIGLTSINEDNNYSHSVLKVKDVLHPSFSFLLPKDHGLDYSVNLWVFDLGESKDAHPKCLMLSSLAECCVWKVCVNPTPFSLQPNTLPSSEATHRGLVVVKCSETEDHYDMDISIRGVTIGSANGYFFLLFFFIFKHFYLLWFPDVIVTTDRENPSWSAHQVTLTLPDVTPLILEVPWPFLSNEIQISLHKNKKGKKNRIRLILKKSLHDPWPKEFGGRSKWDINCFRPWREIEEHGTLEMHLEAQFQCDHLVLEKSLFKKKEVSALDEVREIVRAIFYGHHRNLFFLFAIYDHLNPDEPVMHLKIQPPVRFFPQGSPLLLISVIDHQLAKKLIEQGKLGFEQNQDDFHRIVTERVSREVCTIRLSSTGELNVLRYALRVNSTRMRRSAWQSKNLPRYEDNPWIPTFISPLYFDNTLGFCDTVLSEVLGNKMVVPKEGKAQISLRYRSETFDFAPFLICASCYVKKIEMKKCGRCKKISYCSNACQKTGWITHRDLCVS